MRAYCWWSSRNCNLAAVAAVPGRNPVPPPELPRNHPVADVAHPVEKCLAAIVGNDRNVVTFDRFHRAISQRTHRAEPLVRSSWLDNRFAAFAQANRQGMVCDLFQQSMRLQVLGD